MARKPRSTRLAVALAGALAALAGVGLGAGTTAPAPTLAGERSSLLVETAVVTVELLPPMLEMLGLRVVAVEPTAPAHDPHPLFVGAAAAPSFTTTPAGLRVELRDGAFAGFSGGGLRLSGGFRAGGRAGAIDLVGAQLRPGTARRSLELVDAGGVPLLATAQPMWEVVAGGATLRVFNADLRVLPALAERLGRSALAGTTVGVLALDAGLEPAPPPRRRSAVAGAVAPPPTCSDWSGVVDVALVDIDLVQQAGPLVPGPGPGDPERVIVVPSVTLKNVGTANVPWYPMFSGARPPYGNDQHPFLVWQLVRWAGGALEPLGRSDMKHAFATSNDNCVPGACTHRNILGIGCEDLYPVASNVANSLLGPRHEVTASTGVWTHCWEPNPPGVFTPTHFQAYDDNGLCRRGFSGAGETYATHGLDAGHDTLGDPDARYFMEAFYVVRDDVDVFNSMGYLEVRPQWDAGTGVWTFPAAAPYALGPAIDLWSPPAQPGGESDNRYVETGEGRVQLAVRVTDLRGGLRRYAYALQNHDFDRKVRSVRLPFATAGVQNLAFADGDALTGNDWVPAVDAGGITWTAPAGNELDWATLFAFRFDAAEPPGPALARLAVHEPGTPGELDLRTLVPGAAEPPASFFTVTPCRLLDTRTPGDGAAPVGSGRRRELTAAGRCGVPAGATAVALNVTVTGPTAAGHVVAHSADLSRAPATSDLAFASGITRANNAVVALSPQGRLALRPVLADAGASAHLVVDVVGYFAPAP